MSGKRLVSLIVSVVSIAGCGIFKPSNDTQTSVPRKGSVVGIGRTIQPIEKDWTKIPFTSHVVGSRSVKTIGSRERTDIETIKVDSENPIEFIPDRTYVEFRNDATKSDIDAFMEDFNAIVQEHILLPVSPDDETPSRETNSYVISFDDTRIPKSDISSQIKAMGGGGALEFSSIKAAKAFQQVALAKFNSDKYKIRHVGLDFQSKVFHSATQEYNGYNSWDPGNFTDYYPYWSHGNFYTSTPGAWYGGNRINSLQGSAWDYSTGSGIKVAVIDTEFLLANTGGTPEAPTAELLGNNYCAGGCYYWNFRTNSSNIQTYVPNATVARGHGRKMASLIFSKSNDSKGVAGVAEDAQPILLDVGDSSGNIDNTMAASAINLAVGWGARVINMSWGVEINPSWLSTYSSLYSPIVSADSSNVIQVAATGNDGNKNIFPAAYGEVMGVSAHAYDGSAYYVSGSGYANTWFADVFAAGQATVAGDASAPSTDSLSYFDVGTSGACALVSGTCALLVERSRISSTGTAISDIQSDAWYNQNGYYILDAYWGMWH